MGGGVNGGRVFANWPGLAPADLDNGDLSVTTDSRDVLGEITSETGYKAVSFVAIDDYWTALRFKRV